MHAAEPTAPPDRPPGPRARFPGQLVFALRGDPLNFLARAARAYGDAVNFRIGPFDYYLLSDPAAVREVLVTRADDFTKGPALQRAKVTLGEGLLTSEDPFHKRQRRLSQPAFHPQRVAGYADVFARYAADTAGAWRDGEALDLHEQMMAYTLRVVSKTLFDADVKQEVEEIGRAMDVTVKMFTRALSPWAPLLNRLPLPSNFRFRRAFGRLNDTIARFIAERRAAGVDRGDLLSMLLKVHDVEEGEPDGGGRMSDAQLRDECYTLFTAGHETTANALAFTWHLLARHPEAQARLHVEIDSVLGAGGGARLPVVEDLARLPYARAVLSEAMRLYPPAWVLGRQAKREVPVPGGWTLPAGAVVLASQWVIHRDPRWWPAPEKFDPGRWLGDPKSADARPRYAYFPFGGGPRSCIGESFAWSEAVMALATIARAWRVEPATPEATRELTPRDLRPTITLRPRGPIRLVVRRRG